MPSKTSLPLEPFNRRDEMKAIVTATFALVLSTSFALAQVSQVQSGASTGGTNSFPNSEKPRTNSGMSNTENVGTRNGEMTEPGDFAVTDGLSARSRVGNPTGLVDPGTSNSPAGNAGGE
jgi:hypothetical protein